MLGPWRDPISGRWVVAKPPLPIVVERALENPAQVLLDRIRINDIWRAVQASAEASQISDTPMETPC
jgi:hypothetical protein